MVFKNKQNESIHCNKGLKSDYLWKEWGQGGR